MTRLVRFAPDRLRVLRALAAGGRVERRRCYPFPPKYSLVRVNSTEPPAQVHEYVVADLAARGLIQPARQPDLSVPNAADAVDWIITETGKTAAANRGLVVDDPQLPLLEASA